VRTELSQEAAEFGRLALRALEEAGGDALVQDAEQKPDGRESLVAPVLAGIGGWDLDPHGNPDELEAAAALCRSAGYWAAPYPVAERLAVPADLRGEADGLIVVSEQRPSGAVAGLGPLRWIAATLDGRRFRAEARPSGAPARETAMVADLELRALDGPLDGPLDDGGGERNTADLALGLVLPCWTLLGMLDRALDLARTHVRLREQFGQPLAKFQGVQFQLTDAEVERAGVDVLAAYALWSVQDGRPEAVDDALALRLAAVEAAETVFRIAHQLHGAIGFCDETPLSWVSRYSQPLRRLPFGPSATREQLTRRIGRHGLTGLFG
jgi:hypothetical protein